MATHHLAQVLAQLTGRRIPGGCLDCDAYQTVDTSQAPVFHLTVHHDDTCPTYRKIRRTR